MHGTGQMMFGGGGVVGAINVELTLDNGDMWEFTGGLVGFEAGMAFAVDGDGEFPGISHIEGKCAVSIVGSTMGDGQFTIRWRDWQGEIGEMHATAAGGGSIIAAGGFGSWTRSTGFNDPRPGRN